MSLDLRVASFESNPLMKWALETVKAAIPRGYESVSLLAYQDDPQIDATAHALDREGNEVDCRTLILEGETWHAASLLMSTQLTIHSVLIGRYAKVGYEAQQAEMHLASEPWQAAGIDISYTPGRDRLGIDILISK